MNSTRYTFVLDEPRLRMTVGGRILVRIITSVGYAVLFVVTATSLTSDVLWLKWVGVALVLFLLDRLVHIREADIPLTELPEKGEVNLARFVEPRAMRLVERAHERGQLRRSNAYLEVARGLLREKEIREGLVRLDVSPDEFEDKLEEFVEKSMENEGEERKTRLLRKQQQEEAIAGLLTVAFVRAVKTKQRFVGVPEVFFALTSRDDRFLKRLFETFGIASGDLGQALIFNRAKRQSVLRRIKGIGGFMFEAERRGRHRTVNRAWTSRPTKTLDRYAVDLTALARRGRVGFLVGHEEEYRRLAETLSRAVNPNALLVGGVGMGKETLIGHLAADLIRDKVPKALFDKRLVSLDLARLVAGASPEELQARLAAAIDEITAAGNVILVIPDIHNLVKTSGDAFLSAADALLPIVMNDTFPIIGTTYPQEFKKYIDTRSDFRNAFETIQMQEISEEDARTVLIYESILLERNAKRIISFGAIKMAVRLAKKYFRSKPLPGSAEELLKSAVARAEGRGERVVTPEIVVAAAEEKTNVPIREADSEERTRLLHLEDLIHKRLIDQEEAVGAVAGALREYRSGLSRPGDPIASFLFVGPTGVGKTELAKTLTEILFASEKFLTRFDMTEYQELKSIDRFIGTADGAVRGALTDTVREKPYSVVLLDEFEKAHPDIMELFLQVLDDGRLTDGMGRVVDFEHVIVIATSNAHSNIINESLRKGESVAQIGEYVKQRLVDVFKPELLNRFSRIVVFKDLAIDEVKQIAAIKLKDVAKTVEDKGITLKFDDAVVARIAKLGYDPAFGARPINRAIDEHIRAGLATYMLKHKVPRGSEMEVKFNGKKFVFGAVL